MIYLEKRIQDFTQDKDLRLQMSRNKGRANIQFCNFVFFTTQREEFIISF